MSIKIPNTKTKMPRSFTVNGESYVIVKKYQALRPIQVGTNRLFLNYQNGKCTNQVIGKNQFGHMPQQTAQYLGLPNPMEYNGHSFRRTSATLLADSGANITTLKRHGGCKSDKIVEGYIEESVNNKIEINKQITKFVNLPSSTKDDVIYEDPLKKDKK